ncbi:MAG: prepilin-type N-terminal cleavage/methylation domain-containing protein [Pirellulales bacterium]|nr:prepilin-type N-terminal cleavage/methylation domain-containing protein [Pirellulales bacterium]
MDNSQSRRQGLSLLELLLVVTIIGIVASIIVGRISTNTDMAKVRSCFHNRSEINSASERWFIYKNSWPAANLSDIAADPNYFPSGIPVCPVTGSAYALNATTNRVEGHVSYSVPGVHCRAWAILKATA